MKLKYSHLFFLFLTCLNSFIYSQSVGLGIGSDYYDINFPRRYDLEYSVQNAMLHYTHDIASNLSVSIILGYGWVNYLNERESPSITQEVSSTKSEGYPLGLEIDYFHSLDKDSTFTPFLGFGVEYSDFKTTYRKEIYSQTYISKLSTSGYSQYISFGINVRVFKNLISFIKFKKMMLNNIKTTGDLVAITGIRDDRFSQNYSPRNGILNIGITFGFCYKF